MKNRKVFPCRGGNETPRFKRWNRAWVGARSGFTLIEICTVMFVILIMLGMLTPALQSAFLEQEMRADTHELSLMVKTAMIQCASQHRPYAIDLTATSISLHPMEVATPDPGTLLPDQDKTDEPTPPEDFTATQKLDRRNKLLLPDPKLAKAWLPVRNVTWIFEAGALCPASRVRLVQGTAWIEIGFNALTGNPENETASIP